MGKRVRLGLSQRLNIGDFEGVEVHVEVEGDVDSPADRSALSQELSDMWEKEAIKRLTEVEARRAQETPVGELQKQIRDAAPRK